MDNSDDIFRDIICTTFHTCSSLEFVLTFVKQRSVPTRVSGVAIKVSSRSKILVGLRNEKQMVLWYRNSLFFFESSMSENRHNCVD